MNNIIDISWCLIRDFNKLSYPNNKLWGSPPHLNRFQRLNNFLSCINAGSLQVSRHLFTWNKRVHAHSVYEFLDKQQLEMTGPPCILVPMKCMEALHVQTTVPSSCQGISNDHVPRFFNLDSRSSCVSTKMLIQQSLTHGR